MGEAVYTELVGWCCYTVIGCWEGGRGLREMRSKFFFSSGFLFTWQVSRLSLAGGLLAWETGSEDVIDGRRGQN